MKKLSITATAVVVVMASGSAFAADLGRPIVKAPVVAPAPITAWTGCYLGVHGGGGWGNKRVNDDGTGFVSGVAGARLFDFDTSGWLAGGQVGCDFQTGAFVFGIEGSASGAGIDGSGDNLAVVGGFPAGVFRARANADFIGTLTGRIGMAWGQSLLYVKGGAAWVHDDYRVDTGPFLVPIFPLGTRFLTGDQTHFGWTVGAGWEYLFAPSWSFKIEYNFIDVSRENVDFRFTPAFGGGACCSLPVEQQIHVVKAGINWRFNWGGPVMASY